MKEDATRKLWTAVEVEQLRALYPTVTTKALAGVFACTARQVFQKAKRMRLFKIRVVPRKLWTKDESKQLRALYPYVSTQSLTIMFQCDRGNIFQKANRMGLRKCAAYLATPEACRLRRGDGVGAATRFKKGHAPANKGKKFDAGGRSAETRFKPGKLPKNYLPIGSERVDGDGYLRRKLTETGHQRRDWIAVHILLWIEHRGPIPAGHAVVFINKNKADVRLQNLELVTRADLMLRNSIHRYPEDLKKTIRLVGKLNRTIEKANEKQN